MSDLELYINDTVSGIVYSEDGMWALHARNPQLWEVAHAVYDWIELNPEEGQYLHMIDWRLNSYDLLLEDCQRVFAWMEIHLTRVLRDAAMDVEVDRTYQWDPLLECLCIFFTTGGVPYLVYSDEDTNPVAIPMSDSDESMSTEDEDSDDEDRYNGVY